MESDLFLYFFFIDFLISFFYIADFCHFLSVSCPMVDFSNKLKYFCFFQRFHHNHLYIWFISTFFFNLDTLHFLFYDWDSSSFYSIAFYNFSRYSCYKNPTHAIPLRKICHTCNTTAQNMSHMQYHCAKYVTHAIPLRKICQSAAFLWLAFSRIVDSVLIRKKMGQRKPVFCQLLRRLLYIKRSLCSWKLLWQAVYQCLTGFTSSRNMIYGATWFSQRQI